MKKKKKNCFINQEIPKFYFIEFYYNFDFILLFSGINQMWQIKPLKMSVALNIKRNKKSCKQKYI